MTTVTKATVDQTNDESQAVDDFATRVLQAVLGAQEVQAMYLGSSLGWYKALADHEWLTARQLADLTHSNERYAREWLEHQAVASYLTVDDASAEAHARRYSLPRSHAEVLTDIDSQSYLTPLSVLTVGCGEKMSSIANAYKHGGGVGWADFGSQVRAAQAAMNRPLYLHALGQHLLPQVPELHERLLRGGRVADIGCGCGWSTIGLAQTYQDADVHGFDIDGPSIDAARQHARQSGIADRIEFLHTNAATVGIANSYDAVFAFECLHDMPDPVGALQAMRTMARDDGYVIVMDERTEPAFSAPGTELERLLYGYSIVCCLVDSMSTTPSTATGTVMRPSTLEAYAKEAGFRDIEILDIEHDFFRFYRLVQ